ncbi:DUF1254 domain-containing protein [Croceibacterium sp. LX-88]|uniref:DUF1254 domain-containing protein n=1 Tax=Croceibacterium selenioxidans TaxID=2838833 RepID=A0ABS5W244_9SPHN|nr:DUF1254 domain-containing protein [Croceibacterium selenioxidans]MBT2133197.1 DUF1254 domain-containing protein [Croceibacterium selenioxidans]
MTGTDTLARPATARADGELPYPVRQFTPAHADLKNGAGVPASLASEHYVEALARVVYVWGHPLVNTVGRTSTWELMEGHGPGMAMGLFPGCPKNWMGYVDDYLPAQQRKVVTPNNDTIYGACFADLGEEPVVIQTPQDVPEGHYWTIQIVDAFTTVTHQLGSASRTPAGKFLWVGPEWHGETPQGFVEVLRSPTNIGVAMARSFASRTPEGKARARAVLNQMGALPLSADKPGRHQFDCEASARNKVYPEGLNAAILAADPDLLRNRPVHGETFWDDLERALDANPLVGPDDAPMAAQARTLIDLRKADQRWKALLDRAALTADAELYEGARYDQVGVDAGNGWQRQENGGAWKTDWYGRALAAVIYIYVNDYHEAIYFIRGTDAKGELLQGRYRYTMRFEKDQLPPVDRTTGGFWSLTMYDRDYFMTPSSPNARHNIGTVNLDADELKFGEDGSLTLVLSRDEPEDAEGKANWLPAPDDQFALLLRTYVPTEPLLNGSYKLPEVKRSG